MDKKMMCIIFSTILVILSIVSSFVSINLNIIIGIISIPVLVFASMYSKDYKNENGKSPNGVGLIDFGAVFNIVGGVLFGSFNTIGSLFILIGLLMFLFSKK